MTITLLIILLTIAALYGRTLANTLKSDGYGRPNAGRTPPPRSHFPDLFDPTRTA